MREPTDKKKEVKPVSPTVTLWFDVKRKDSAHVEKPAEEIIASIANGQYAKAVGYIRETFDKVYDENGGEKNDKPDPKSKKGPATEAATKAISADKQALMAPSWSGVSSKRGDKNCESYSGLLCADLDHVRPRVRLKTLRLAVEQDPHVHAVFVSPSGDGLKVLFAVAGGLDKHLQNYFAVAKYVKDKWGLDVDAACKNVERLCFVSYDPAAKWKADAVPLEPTEEAPAEPEKPVNTKPKSKQPKPVNRKSEVENEAEPDLDKRREIAEELLGEIDWQDDETGFCDCPGKEQHTNGDGPKDCKVMLDGAPTLYCVHQSCQEVIANVNKELRSKVGRAEYNDGDFITLPSAHVSFSDFAADIFARDTGLFYRGGTLCELVHEEGNARLELVRPDGFRSRIEKLGKLAAWRKGRGGETVLQRTHMSADCAKAVMSTSEARDLLPPVANVVRCPVITEQDGKLLVLGKGYHRELGGLVILDGEHPIELPLQEAVGVLLWTVEELAFQTKSDKSRAMAARITPALKLGGFLTGSTPLDVMESDQPQAGKGYSHSITAAIYNEQAYMVQQRNGGVGSSDESFAAALVAGRPFVALDNVRGKLDSCYLESFITAPGLFPARVPGCRETLIDPHRYILQLTSNGMASTPDLAKRSSICRILKQPGKALADIPGKIRQDQSLVLAAVFAVVREWYRQGKPRTADLRHDFRDWCQTLDWIVQHLLGCAPLMDGHAEAQDRVSSPALIWLRAVAIALESTRAAGRGPNGQWAGRSLPESRR